MATPKVTHLSYFVVGMAMYLPLNVTEICLSTSAASCRSIASFESPWSFLTKRKSLAMAISYKIRGDGKLYDCSGNGRFMRTSVIHT